MNLQKFYKNGKRSITALLAIIFTLMTLNNDFTWLKVEGAGIKVTQSGGNLLDGQAFNFYGHAGRTGIFKWTDAKGCPIFCIQPTKAMQTGAGMELDWLSVNADWSVDIDNEQKELLFYALASSGCSKGNSNISTGQYIMVQSAVWAIVSGEWTNVEDFKVNMDLITSHIRNNQASVKQEVDRLADQFVKSINSFSGNHNLYIPDFGSKSREDAAEKMMTDMGDGTYKITFHNLNQNIINFEYEKPPGWDWYYEGNSITFICDTNAGGNPISTLRGTPKAGTVLSTLIGNGQVGILIPNKNGNQAMITQVEGAPWVCYVRFNRGITMPKPGEGSYSLDSHRYEHEETFKANYKIALDKKDAETGKALADTTFDILEVFDKSQLKGTNLAISQFKKEPIELTVHDQVTTDQNGYLSHGDSKTYKYEKTYCGGHPAPIIEYALKINSDEGSQEQQAVIDEVNTEIDELNSQLEADAWAAWQADVDSCAAECDFHHIEKGVAQKQMEEDRDEAYQSFINLKYIYTVQEVKARNGYILHDLHTDDIPINMVSLKSSQVEGVGEVIGTYYKGKASLPTKFSDLDVEIQKPSRETDSIGWDGNYEESEVSPVNQERYANNKIGFVFRIADHRTEGELHINKRDLELYNNDATIGKKDGYTKEDSYGQTQGDATLEGAVYGLYAAEDIIHPDGVTGKVFSGGDLVAVATTDKSGDASFVSITEKSAASISVPNLYMEGKTLHGISYPDNIALNGNQWIGRPLFLGSYYIKEISRSEGYELSQYGINLTESNRQGDALILAQSGSASVGSLFHRINEWDGSWNDFDVKSSQTVNGYDIYITGYPTGSKFYEVIKKNFMVPYEIIIDEREVPKTDGDGNQVYYKAKGGEYKYDQDGNRILKTDEEGNPVYDTSNPIKETLTVTNKVNYYPDRTFLSNHADKYTESVDNQFIIQEVNELLNQMNYKVPDSGAPIKILNITDALTNGDVIDLILNYCESDDFWDGYQVLDMYQSDTDFDSWSIAVAYNYSALSNVVNFYDQNNDRVILKKDVAYESGSPISEGYCYIIVNSGDFIKTGSRILLNKIIIQEPSVYGKIAEQILYNPVYETYMNGEILSDNNGYPIRETETVYTYGTEIVEEFREELQELTDVNYDAAAGIYTIHVPNITDWKHTTETKTTTYRAVAPNIEKDGIPYADYILQKGGGGVSVFSKNAIAAGSYIKSAILLYPGQLKPCQDAGTREVPITVLQRIIKQAVKVVKDISRISYDQVNTYAIHKDPFTILYGGYGGNTPAKALPGFKFKLYLVSDLIATGKLEYNPDGSFNYKKFFSQKENSDIFKDLAVKWDRPNKDADGDLTTLHANIKGSSQYYGTAIMLPYGTYVIVEQQPMELINKHYKIDDPKEITLPFAPEIGSDGTVYDTPSIKYFYDSTMTPEKLMENYYIRFNEETHVIYAHNRDGNFEVYKYGLDRNVKPNIYGNPAVAQYYKYGSTSEHSGIKDGIFYNIYVDRGGSTTGYGITLNDISTMTGITTAIDRKYAAALVPWSVLDPRYGEVINDNGDIGNRDAALDQKGNFNFVGFAATGFENVFYKSKLRIEKIDSETGENIIHDGAYFKIYAAMRDVTGGGTNGVEGTGDILFDAEGVPIYDEDEQITMRDTTGAEVGIFRAYSTIRDLVTIEGVKQEKVGYIETYQPLGAGVYVLAEISAPDGYLKSKPIAFEVYSDGVTYYHNGQKGDKRVAEQFQYVIPFTDTKEIVSQILVEDEPTHIAIHKVEDGTATITFEARGTKALLEARGDVENITYDFKAKEYYGTITKFYEQWSENIITGTLEQLKAMENVKLLYDMSGNFLGKGIRFDVYVHDASISLFKGIQIDKVLGGGYKGISVEYQDGKVSKITVSETGTHTEITTHEQDRTAAHNAIYDSGLVKNTPVNILFYDLNNTSTEMDEETKALYILDGRGNRTCMADPVTGMAYVLDDYGTIIVYPVDKGGNKITSQSIKIHTAENGKETIYTDVKTKEDENGLPIYYEEGHITSVNDVWVTGGEKHPIARLAFGAYILEETMAPYDQGYIWTKPIGFILKETNEEQDFFLEDDFTKAEIAKVDITTKEEIMKAHMILYYANKIEDDSDKEYHLEYVINESGNKKIYTDWISGYEYDDNENLKTDDSGKKIPTTKPHWIDHIPVGCYILEEADVPYESGYVQSPPIDIIVTETGKVQSFVMEDDYTSIEIIKTDANKDVVLPEAKLGLYKSKLDEKGKPLLDKEGIPQIDTEAANNGHILTWITEDGKDVAATAYPMKEPITGEQLFDKKGEPLIGYQYDIKKLATTQQGQYYITETGALHIDYIPIGYYVLVEEETPQGFETAVPMLVHIRETGSKIEVQKWNMKDYPLTTIDLEKLSSDTKKPLAGAKMQLTDSGGTIVETWISTKEAYRITALTPGEYTLTELEAPTGYKIASPITFTVMGIEIQLITMIDYLKPSGGGRKGPEPEKPYISKEDLTTAKKLPGAWIIIYNSDGSIYTKGQTDNNGRLHFELPPEGTYTFQEIAAPDGYYLNETIFTFKVDKDGKITGDKVVKDAKKQKVILSKADVTNAKELPGATIEIYDKDGNTIFRGVTDLDGKIYFEAFKQGTYTFKETISPDGYKINETVFSFIIHEDGSITGDKMIFDEPKTRKVPNIPVPKTSDIPAPKTGDNSQLIIYLAVSLIFICVIIPIVFIVKNSKKKIRNDAMDYFR